MNERLLEFADKAGADIWDDQASAGQYFDIEKFAEILVREFIVLADEFELDVNRSGLVDRIKEHFGVE